MALWIRYIYPEIRVPYFFKMNKTNAPDEKYYLSVSAVVVPFLRFSL